MQKLIVFIIINIITFTVSAENQLTKTIQQKINNTDPNLNIGIKITNLDQNKVIFEKNTDRYFIPASTLKFITVISLIEYFGLDYKFTNKVLNSGNNYYLDIHDPEFKTPDLNSMISAIGKHAGKTIKGNIYIVNKEFTVPHIMDNKTYSDTIYCNGGLITKVHINKNCTKLSVGSSQIGKKIKINKPQNFPYKINNRAITTAKHNIDKLHVNIRDGDYIVDGTLCDGNKKLIIGAVAHDNFDHVKFYIKQSLEKNGIKLKGKILRGVPKGKIKTIACFSKTMQEIANVAIKQSNNFTTDYLLAEFATQNNQKEWISATDELKNFISEKFNVDLTSSQIQDASGISRLNLVTVNQLDSFLKSVSKKPNFIQIKSILAHPGEGTLEGRFKGMNKFYAKTGRLSNVSNIVGYFYNKNNELHSFVIMSNNFYGPRMAYKKLEEEIIRLVADQ